MLVDPIVLLAFVPAALALNFTPGADMLFCLGLGLRSGARSALAASAGISVGGFIHALMAGLGLSALLAAVPAAFDVIRWVGVAYLLWLAWGALRQGVIKAEAPIIAPKRAFWQGLIVNLTNPKVILFILAFIPQFVDLSKGNVLAQFLIFGFVISIGGFVINGLVGVFAGGIGHKLTQSKKFARGLGIASAGIFSGLALRLALLER